MPVSTSSRTPAWEGGVDWDCWVSGRGWGLLCGSDGGDEFLQVNSGQLVGEVGPNVFFHWHTTTHRLPCPLNKKQTYNQSPPLTGFLLNSPMPPSRASFISLAAAIRSSSCRGRRGQRDWRVVCCYLHPKQQQCKEETSACCCAFQEHSVCTEATGAIPSRHRLSATLKSSSPHTWRCGLCGEVVLSPAASASAPPSAAAAAADLMGPAQVSRDLMAASMACQGGHHVRAMCDRHSASQRLLFLECATICVDTWPVEREEARMPEQQSTRLTRGACWTPWMHGVWMRSLGKGGSAALLEWNHPLQPPPPL